MYKFDEQMLDQVQLVHDNSGPRTAFAYYLGRSDYMKNTADLNTTDVEDFIIEFYTEYNKAFGQRY